MHLVDVDMDVSRYIAVMEVDTKEYGRLAVMAVDDLKSLPSAKCEEARPCGEWLSGRDIEGIYVEVCSQCGYVERDVDPDHAPNTELCYCRKCGAWNEPVKDPAYAIVRVNSIKEEK